VLLSVSDMAVSDMACAVGQHVESTSINTSAKCSLPQDVREAPKLDQKTDILMFYHHCSADSMKGMALALRLMVGLRTVCELRAKQLRTSVPAMLRV
jgi:hypothetical protein